MNNLYEVLANNGAGSFPILIGSAFLLCIVLAFLCTALYKIIEVYYWINDLPTPIKALNDKMDKVFTSGCLSVGGLVITTVIYWYYPPLLWGIVIAIGLTASAHTARMILRKSKNKQN